MVSNFWPSISEEKCGFIQMVSNFSPSISEETLPLGPMDGMGYAVRNSWFLLQTWIIYRLFCSTNTSARYYVEKTGEKTPYRGKTTQASAQPWQSGTLICSCQSSIMLCTCGLLGPSHHMSHRISSNSIFFLESFLADQFLQAKLCLGHHNSVLTRNKHQDSWKDQWQGAYCHSSQR